MRNDDDEFARKNGKSRGLNWWVSQLISIKIKMLWERLLSSLNLCNLPQLHTGFAHIAHSQDNSFENQLLWNMVKSHWKGNSMNSGNVSEGKIFWFFPLFGWAGSKIYTPKSRRGHHWGYCLFGKYTGGACFLIRALLTWISSRPGSIGTHCHCSFTRYLPFSCICRHLLLHLFAQACNSSPGQQSWPRENATIDDLLRVFILVVWKQWPLNNSKS